MDRRNVHLQKIEMLAFRKAEAVALKVIPLNVSIIARFNPDLSKELYRRAAQAAR